MCKSKQFWNTVPLLAPHITDPFLSPCILRMRTLSSPLPPSYRGPLWNQTSSLLSAARNPAV
ncbi:hypothetical protein GmHk_11G030949 [Glycine max]|nr:hypothetical protein GmHk_11G030949 [Glycine max]